MAWTTPRTWVTSEVVTASIMNTHVRDNFEETGPHLVTSAGQYLVASSANNLTVRGGATDEDNTAETTASTSYTDLATSGPNVTRTVGDRALVLWSARMSNNTAGETCFVSIDISGANTSSATDSRSIRFESDSANQQADISGHRFYESMSAGSSTFKLEYKVSGGTGNFDNRRITVFPY